MTPSTTTPPSQVAASTTHGEQPAPNVRRGLVHSFRGWREGIRSRPHHDRAYKIAVGLIGAAIVVAGVVLLPLPGPGWVVIFVGLAVLASEFAWAKRLERFTRQQVRSWNEWLLAQRLAVRLALWTVTAIVVAAILYGVLVLMGIPSWVPGWLVPPIPGL